jgi:hypothetical protein
MPFIDKRGFVNDGTMDLTVGGNHSTVGNHSVGGNQFVTGSSSITGVHTVGSLKHAPQLNLMTTGNVPLPGSGHYQVPVAVGFTGSVPSPVQWPCSILLVTETGGNYTFMLSGSSTAPGRPLFVMPPGTTSTNGRGVGATVTVSKGGSIGLISDGAYWLIMAGSGSFTLG